MFILLIKSTGEKSHKNFRTAFVLFKAFVHGGMFLGVKVIFRWSKKRDEETLYNIERKKSVACLSSWNFMIENMVNWECLMAIFGRFSVG